RERAQSMAQASDAAVAAADAITAADADAARVAATVSARNGASDYRGANGVVVGKRPNDGVVGGVQRLFDQASESYVAEAQDHRVGMHASAYRSRRLAQMAVQAGNYFNEAL
ncbi:hypothetical protein GGH98_002293, partial [Coemansia sp. RSA 454]